MERLELEASEREVTGKKVRFLRREGITPANLYGHGIDSISLQIDTKQLEQAFAKAGKTSLITLKIADLKTPKTAIVREVQKNPLTGKLLHIDFYQVKMTEKIKADVPLVFSGEAPALKNKNTTLLRLINSLSVEALPDALPHSLEVDVSSLEETDQAIYVKDILLDDGVTLLSDPAQMVLKVVEARREAAAEVEEEAAVEKEPQPQAEPTAEE